MSSSSPPPAAPGDSEPATPSLPGVAVWSDSEGGERAAAPGFSGLVATPADRAMPTIGHIGRYALKYQLGSGGLGTVFAAHDPLLSRLIAVKTLNVEIKEAERESFNTLFINEARAAGGLSHPHIVTVFDAGISDNRAYIAMELLKGRDLRQLRQEGWRATPAQAALIVRRVADALAFAHSKGVIHRDIKPANIFMVGRTQPRVLDFGIARVAHRQDGDDSMPGAGSPYYMAPEQVKRLPADRRADVFSLGVVLYELLTDVKPFQGKTLKEITTAVLTHEPPLACKVETSVPKTLADITARAMAKDPELRFRSARSFARELRQWLDANPVAPEAEATSPTPVSEAPKRRRAPWLAATALALLTAAAAGGWWWHTTQTTSAVATTPMSLRPARLDVATPLPPALAVVAPTMPAAPPANASTTLDSASSTTVATAAAASAANTAADALLLATIVPTSMTPPGTTSTPTPTSRDAAAADNTNPGMGTSTVPATALLPHRSELTSNGVAPTSTTAPLKESTKERRAREAREREARDRAAQLASASALVAPANATVKIAISPWGQVEVDGAISGVAPPLTELTLAEGRHQIVVRNGDFAPYVTTINVTGGQTISLHHKFGSQ